MKGKQTALMPGNGDKVGFWLTPPELMKKLEDEFHFDMDACPYPRPAGFDGLKEEWGRSTYVNPPFFSGHSIEPWVRKAVLEAERGKTVVLILPITDWMNRLMEVGPEFRFVGRVKWCAPDGTATPRPRFPSALFILRPKQRPSPPTAEAEPPKQ